MTTKPDLDALLAAPLEPVDDNGFSSRVVARIPTQSSAVTWLEGATIVAALAFAMLFVPVVRLTAPFETVAVDLSLSLPFAVACAAIVLSQATFRLLPD